MQTVKDLPADRLPEKLRWLTENFDSLMPEPLTGQALTHLGLRHPRKPPA
jgi:hypothetical protein